MFIERYDGSRWRSFALRDRGVLVFTSRGQELLSNNPLLRSILVGYKNEAVNNRTDEFRRWFRAGGNSDVYTLNSTPLVIKEASTAHSVWSALDRMDYLHGICLRSLPNYVRVPDHYAALYSKNLKKQYLVIQKVNDGITVADLINGVVSVDSKEKELAMRDFGGLEEQVIKAIDKSPGRDAMPKNLLPDWDAGNVVVDFDTSTRLKPFTYWIIDQ